MTQLIHPSAPPNRLAPDALRVRPGKDGVSLAIDPTRAGWRHLTFRTVSLGASERLAVGSAGSETALVVLAGGGLIVEPASGPALTLEGRRSAFSGKPWAAYLPDGHPAHVTARPLDGGQVLVAIAEAPSSGQAGVANSPILIRPGDVKVEVRGAGNATRRIHHIIAPDFPADRLELVEVYTPAGNWSSWPPHKHDVDDMPNEAVLEEIYYYQQRRREGWAVQRLSRR
jgi:5-deoxy-glucuronate isomerase